MIFNSSFVPVFMLQWPIFFNFTLGVLYKITTYTGEKRGAGTDANAYITLFGKDGSSTGKLALKRDTSNAFRLVSYHNHRKNNCQKI